MDHLAPEETSLPIQAGIGDERATPLTASYAVDWAHATPPRNMSIFTSMLDEGANVEGPARGYGFCNVTEWLGDSGFSSSRMRLSIRAMVSSMIWV